MTVLVQCDLISVGRPSVTLDEHGWANETGVTHIATVKGTIQEQRPSFDATASNRGGAGPNEPFHLRIATAYLSERVEPGDSLTVVDTIHQATTWQVQRCRLVEDPRGGGFLNVWVADCVEGRQHA